MIGVGWKDRQRLVEMRATYARQVARAAEHGVSLDSSKPIRVTKRQREDRETKARLAIEKFTAFGKAFEAFEAQRGPADLEFQKQSIEFLACMEALDASQFRLLLSEVGRTDELSDDTRWRLISGSLRRLAHADPHAALTVLTESSDLFNNPGLVENLISEVLGPWAKTDPGTALEWFRKNAAKSPEFVTDEPKSSSIVGVSVGEPKLALRLIDEFGVTNPVQTVREIASAASSAEARSAMVVALREYFATVSDPEIRKQAAIQSARSLARGARRDGFEAASEWIAGAGFAAEELHAIAEDLSDVKRDETGKWLEWIGETLPADLARDRAWHLFSKWTDADSHAAGTWLATAADSPTKHTAARAYAEKVFPYDHDTAIQWALSVPAGGDRNRTLKRLHDAWPKDDPAGAAAFAREHGIE